jgi:hypothetical protein
MINSRKMRGAGHVERIREKNNAYRIWVENPKGKGQIGRPSRGWQDNIKMNLTDTGWGGMYRTDLAQDSDQL